LIKKNKYDLLLVDVLMPTPGHEFVKQAKKIITKGTKVILVSIVPEQDVKTEHADGFIQKPFSPSSLLGGVKKLVKK
jgi:two-component SAPR family response regulator